MAGEGLACNPGRGVAWENGQETQRGFQQRFPDGADCSSTRKAPTTGPNSPFTKKQRVWSRSRARTREEQICAIRGIAFEIRVRFGF